MTLNYELIQFVKLSVTFRDIKYQGSKCLFDLFSLIFTKKILNFQGTIKHKKFNERKTTLNIDPN